MTTVHRTCPLCEAVCGLTLTLDSDNRVTSVKGDRDDPFSKGFICPKGASLGKLDEDPDLLTTPMIREGTQWRTATWDEAFDAVAVGLNKVIEEHGRKSLALYLGNPNAHTVAGALYGGSVARGLGTRNIFSASSLDQMPKHVASGLMFGDPLTIAVPDLDRTDYLLMLGANPLESNGSLCTAPNFPGRLKDIRKRGGKLVVVDPRHTRTAALADEHIFVRPGSDAYLLFGIVNVLFAENLTTVSVDVDGLAAIREAAVPFTPEAAAPRTGVPADVIRRIARELAAAPTAAVYGRIGTCTAEFGTVAQWLVDVINVLTGNLDRAGGAMFPRPATALPRRSRPYRTARWTSRVRGLPEANGELPAAALAEEIETPGEGQIRGIITVAGNPVLSLPNGARLDTSLQEVDFMVSVDRYLNETTKHADVILPPPQTLQSSHYDFALLAFAVRNYTRYSPPAVALGDRPSESDILARLAMIAAGLDGDTAAHDELIIDQTLRKAVAAQGSGVFGRDVGDLRASLQGETGAELRLDMMLRLGPYGEWSGVDGADLSLQKLLDNPHGLDLGPLEPQLPDCLITASGKVELAPPQLLADVERLKAGLTQTQPEIVLIGRRQLRSNNSWMHNVSTLVGGSNRCTLLINPADVERLGLGDDAVVKSAAGELIVPLEPTDSIMPGVVSLPHGWGHGASTQSVAAAHAGVNANTLTDDAHVDALSGNAVFNGVPVTVSHAFSVS
ncbi:molybdopterin oxidoreductase family protein [Antrihabitans cavernicola]|uniref:Molybdopterin oxidoreductase family protein n=1 Tax=Antrihabitans cavernicola TaxID=2495913 RepID=A0A5A7SGX3_9NOCA|nr:molybdopterin oxidoreductase family protein [Spelaeibacter cavernicola]KAA0024629.1 molybdopterin oxidoreductase family protein [Spelaeibacter cavernicola]